jgi:4-hydroxy-tetrahydrodipicolinate synthase
MQGIFPVLQTPIRADGSINFDDLKNQVIFCIQTGAHGLVFPVLGSEFHYLSDRERYEGLICVVEASAGQIPVVAGVAAPSASVAAEHAHQAAIANADAVIAMPPYITPAKGEDLVDYFKAISNAAQRPIMVQHARIAPMGTAVLKRLLDEVEHIQYIKEENDPSAHHISEVAQSLGSSCKGIFGGAHGRWMLSEMDRGATGFMPAAHVVDVYAQVWDAFQSGDKPGARQIFNRLLPLINLTWLLGLRVCKEVLKRRGVFQTTHMRSPSAPVLDEADHRELDVILEDLKPLFKV